MNKQFDATPQRQTIDTLITPKWMVTLNAQDEVLEGYSLAIHEHQILAILPAVEAGKRFHPHNQVNLPEHALLPGLINAHGHSAMSLFKGMADDLALMDWLTNHIWPAESAFVSEEFVRDGTLLAIAEMVKTGTTFFSDMYFYPNIAAEVANQQKIRTQICFPILDFPTAWASGPDEYIHKGLEVLSQYKNNRYVKVAFGPHAPYTVSDAPLSKILTLAEQLDSKIQIHLHETAFEVQEAIQKSGKRPLARLKELGLVSPNLQCVHMTQIEEEDLHTLSEAGAHVIHCPESNLKLASGFCPVHTLMQRGINVALGTDGSSSNNNLDMFEEMRTAALLAKAVSGDASALCARDALKMATINGARAIGVEQFTGTLEVGKWADLIAVDLGQIEHQPVYDPVSHLVYCASGKDVTHSWIGGKQHLKDRQLTMIDSIHLAQKARHWAERIKQRPTR